MRRPSKASYKRALLPASLLAALLAGLAIWIQTSAPLPAIPASNETQLDSFVAPQPVPTPAANADPFSNAAFAARIAAHFAPPISLQDAFDSSAIFEEWGALDPEAAITYIAEIIPNRHDEIYSRLFSAVFKGWARVDPLTAWDRLSVLSKKYPIQKVVFECQQTVLAHWLENGSRASFDIALDLISLTSDPAASPIDTLLENRHLFIHALGAITHQNLDYALDFLAQTKRAFEAEPQRSENERQIIDQLTYKLATQWAKSAPADAANWALAQNSANQESILSSIASEWFEANPTASFEWLRDNIQSEELTAIYRRSIWSLARKHPGELRDAIKESFLQHPNVATDPSYIGLALNISRADPQLAIKLLDKHAELKGLETNHLFKIDILKNWAISDAVAANAYLTSLDLEKEENRKLKARFETEFSSDTPFDLLSQLTRDWGVTDYKSFQETGYQYLDYYEHKKDGKNIEAQIATLALGWGQLAPERVRFYLQNQSVLTPERTAEILLKLEQTLPQPAAPFEQDSQQ